MSNFSHFHQFIDKNQYGRLHNLAKRGITAEISFIEGDYNTCLILCRQVVEGLLKWIAKEHGITTEENGQNRKLLDITSDVGDSLELAPYYQRILNNVRILGNEAAHDDEINNINQATEGLQDAYQVFNLLYMFKYAPHHFRPKDFEVPTVAMALPYLKQIIKEMPELINQLIAPTNPTTAPVSNHSNGYVSNQNKTQAQYFFEQAKEAKRNRNYEAYEKHLKQTLEHNPKHKNALYELAMHYINAKKDNPDEIKSLLEQAVKHGHHFAPARLADVLLKENPSSDEQKQKIWQLLRQAIWHNETNKNNKNVKKDNYVYMVCAKIYEKGLLGETKDINKAISYAKQAQKAGNRNETYIQALQNQLVSQPAQSPSTKEQDKVATNEQPTHTTPPSQDDLDWQWWVGLDDRWRELFVTKGLKISPATFNPLDKQQAMSYVKQILQLTELNLEKCSIGDATPVRHLTKLKTIILQDNNINDITPLANLTQLSELWLSDNNISDINPLANLTRLNSLSLSNNNINDISPLANLTWLIELWLSSNNINDISPLANLTELKDLGLRENNINDISPLANLIRLKHLNFNKNNINDISPLANLMWLKYLDLSGNDISDINPLANLTELQHIDLSGNDISDINPLANLTQVGALVLHNNNINDISSLKNLTNLYKELTKLEGNPIDPQELDDFLGSLKPF